MTNLMDIDGYRAVIQYDSEIAMLRGEFIELNGGADFYASDLTSLREEGRRSLKVFLQMCEEDHVASRREYAGEIEIPALLQLHAEIEALTRAHGMSLNSWLTAAVECNLIDYRPAVRPPVLKPISARPPLAKTG